MKTPEEIKKGLECCCVTIEKITDHDNCPYRVSGCKCVDDMANDALEYIKQLEMAARWISVKERLPEVGRLCIVSGGKGKRKRTDLAVRGGSGTWEFALASGFDIECWLPLPTPPKEEE